MYRIIIRIVVKIMDWFLSNHIVQIYLIFNDSWDFRRDKALKISTNVKLKYFLQLIKQMALRSRENIID